MTAAVILLAIALLVLSIILTVGGARHVDLVERYLQAEDAHRRLAVDNAGLADQVKQLGGGNKRLESALRDATDRIARLQAREVAGMDDAALTAALNGVRENEVADGIPRRSSAEVTAPHRAAARATISPGGGMPK